VARNKRTDRRGFTLVEALTSCLILAGSLVALSGLQGRATRSVLLMHQYAAAYQVADRQLTLIDRMGVDAFIEQEIDEGEDEQEGVKYYWSVASELEGIDALYTLEVTVRWQSMGRAHAVRLDTRLNGKTTTVVLDAGQEV